MPPVVRNEMHLVSLRAQTVRVGDVVIAFREGETILTECSYTDGRDEFAQLTGPWEGTLSGCGRTRKAGSASSPATPPSNEWWVTRGYRDALSQRPPHTLARRRPTPGR